jgi:hypothetical protein
MSLQMENAETCFKRLLSESKSPKFHTSLERVRKACNSIVNMKGTLNYSRVAEYTTEHFGGPKRQSIMNKEGKRLRLYIDLRKEEYTVHSKLSKNTKTKSSTPMYFCDDWDLKTKSFINGLQSELAFYKNILCNVKQDIRQETRENPIDYDKSISAGPQDDLSMQVIRESELENENEHLKMIHEIVQRLLDIAKDPNSPLEFKTRDGKEYLALAYGQVIMTVLYSDELSKL